MRGVTFGARSLMALVVVGLIANCSDDPTSPDRADPAALPIAFATADNGAGLSITTDKDDYAPGDTVWFTGTGWTPGDSVDILLTDEPTLDSHAWTVGIGADGTYRDSTYVVDTEDLGVTFTLVATSRSNPAQTLTVVFTDAAPSVTLFTLNGTTFTFPASPPNAPATNPITVAPSAVVTVLVNGATVASGGANPNATWKSTQVSFRGGSINFGDIPVCDEADVVDPSNVTSATRSFTFAAPATSNTYDVRVTALQNDGCSGPGGQLTFNGVLIVSGTVDLSIDKSHTGDFTRGTNEGYTIEVENLGNAGSTGNVTVTDTLPAGLTLVSGTGTGWNACTAAGQVVTCVRPSANPIASGATAPAITLTVDVGAATAASITNRARVNGGGETAPSLTVCDGTQNNCDADPTTVVNSNSPPTAVNDAYSTNEDAPLSVIAADGVLKNDTDPDGNALTAVLVTGPDPAKTGSFNLASDGSFDFTPATDFLGSVTFTYKAFDGLANSTTAATVTITVNSVNDPPSFTNGGDQTVLEDAGAQSVTNWATGISAGPSNESAQTVSFEVTGNTNSGLFSAGPAVSSTGTLTYTPAADANGSATITLVAKDNGGTANGGDDTSDPQTFKITVTAVNDAPSFNKGGNESAYEGAGAQSVSGWATAISAGPADESGQTLTFEITGNTSPGIFSVAPAVAANGTLTYTPSLGPNGTSTITIRVKDNGGIANGGVDTSPTQTFTITVNNVLPTLGAITAPNDPLQVGTLVTASATFTDPGTDDPHTASIDWGDGAVTTHNVAAGSTTASGTHTYSLPGVYTLKMKVQDDVGYSNEVVFQYVVIFDPSAGFVTGGGWIMSPAGAYTPDNSSDPDIVGKATFGFVSKYQKGASAPTGNTEFQFHAASLNFKSTVYEWLVVQGNSKASYKGSGTVNGGGNYGFLLSTVDGGNVSDKFRIKIWDKGTGVTLYDNQVGAGDDATASQLIGDGSIVIHSK